MFLVVFEMEMKAKTVLSNYARKFMAWDETFPTWAEADKMAKTVARTHKVRCWVGEIPDPPIAEVIRPLAFAGRAVGPIKPAP